MQCSAEQCRAVQCSAEQCCAVLCSVVLCSVVQGSVVQCMRREDSDKNNRDKVTVWRIGVVELCYTSHWSTRSAGRQR